MKLTKQKVGHVQTMNDTRYMMNLTDVNGTVFLPISTMYLLTKYMADLSTNFENI